MKLQHFDEFFFCLFFPVPDLLPRGNCSASLYTCSVRNKVILHAMAGLWPLMEAALLLPFCSTPGLFLDMDKASDSLRVKYSCKREGLQFLGCVYSIVPIKRPVLLSVLSQKNVLVMIVR